MPLNPTAVTQVQDTELYNTLLGNIAFQHIAGSPPAPVVTSGAADTRGIVTFGTGTTPAAGAMVVVTFNATFSGAVLPYVVVKPNNTATQALGLYVAAPTASGFTLSCTTAPSASQGNGAYSFSYLVIG